MTDTILIICPQCLSDLQVQVIDELPPADGKVSFRETYGQAYKQVTQCGGCSNYYVACGGKVYARVFPVWRELPEHLVGGWSNGEEFANRLQLRKTFNVGGNTA